MVDRTPASVQKLPAGDEGKFSTIKFFGIIMFIVIAFLLIVYSETSEDRKRKIKTIFRKTTGSNSSNCYFEACSLLLMCPWSQTIPV